MELDMRHMKLSAADAALIAGEVDKPSWASRNEGIHERISFDDTLWGFELAGGAFYKTPLRVVYVKPGSRADQASIRKGDKVLRINGIDTSTLTLQEAHDIVLVSGIHLKISVTSPDDDEDSYYVYEDPLIEESRIAEELRKAMEAERIRRILARAQRSCSLPWPWVKRKIIIYRESNCFLVPSKYEGKHKELFPDLPHVRYTDDICEFNRGTPEETKETKPKEKVNQTNSEETEKGEPVTDNEEDDFDNLSGIIDDKEQNKIINEILEEENEEIMNQNIPSDVEETTHSDIEDTTHSDTNGEVLGPDNEEDGLSHVTEDAQDNINEVVEEPINTVNQPINEEDNKLEAEVDSKKEILEESDDEISSNKEFNETETNDKEENSNPSINIDDGDENVEQEVETSNAPTSDFVNEEDGVNKSDDDNVVDGIVGNGDFDSINER